MRLQDQAGWCSVACVQNALRCLGVKKPQRAIKAQMDLTEDSYEKEIVRALQGFSVDEFLTGDDEAALVWLSCHLANCGPAILLVDDSDHYVTCIGLCGPSFIVFDPSNVADAKTEHGVRVYSWRQLKSRWRSTSNEGDDVWFAVGVSK